MPIKRCKLKDKKKKGFKYGSKGKCYKSRKKAVKQMRAIKASQTRQKEKI